MAKRPSCCMADQFCEAAANYEDRPVRIPTCVACGEDVCRSCSSVRRYRGKKSRLCNGCQIEYLDDGSDHVVLDRIYRKAGYDGAPKDVIDAAKAKARTPVKAPPLLPFKLKGRKGAQASEHPKPGIFGRLLGKRVIRVDTEPCETNAGTPFEHIQRFHFEGGLVLMLVVQEMEDNYGIEGVIIKHPRKSGGAR